MVIKNKWIKKLLGMEINFVRSIKRPVKITCVFLILLLLVSCTYKEPPFIVTGDEDITKNIKVNIEMIKDSGTVIATAFYKGKSYQVDNQGVLRYTIYVSYKDHYFCRIEMDNLHDRIKGKPVNEIIISKKAGSITVQYNSLAEHCTIEGNVLLPSDIFFKNLEGQALIKQKFIAFYTNK